MADLANGTNVEESVPLNTKSRDAEASEENTQDDGVEIDIEEPVKLYFKISDRPPIQVNILLSIQQALLPVSSSLSISLIVSELVCARDDTEIQAQLLGTTFMMAGISTLLMCTVGCRLPIFQGPSSSYVIPLLGLTGLADWSCPSQEYLSSYYANSTMLNGTDYGGRLPVPREIIYNQLSKLQGSLMVAGTIHLLIGLTGLVGVVARFVGPITIVPALLLAVYYLHRIAVKFAETHWGTSVATALCGIVLSLYLRNYKTPIPFWTKKRGFHIIWYPLHQVFSVSTFICIDHTYGFSQPLRIIASPPKSLHPSKYFGRPAPPLSCSHYTSV